jgi:hypothetical protein
MNAQSAAQPESDEGYSALRIAKDVIRGVMRRNGSASVLSYQQRASGISGVIAIFFGKEA